LINQPKSFEQSSRILLVFSVILCNWRHQIAAGPLQQRQLPLLETETAGLISHMLLRAGVERPARSQHGFTQRFRESVEQHAVWSYRCASSNHQPDQRIYSCLSHAAGATTRRLIRAGLFVGLAIWLLSLTFGLIGQLTGFIRRLMTGHGWSAKRSRHCNVLLPQWSCGAFADARESVSNHDRHFLVGSIGSQSSVVAQMTIEAPAPTPQLVVANLAEAAAKRRPMRRFVAFALTSTTSASW